MPPRIVLFGATGYTGDLTARSLVARGAKPLLAARNPERLAALAAELGGLETQVADVSDPESVAQLLHRGDVLISTVGPFKRWGDAAVEAALARGAHYLDSTGEGTFIRKVFEEWGLRAKTGGVGLLTSFGYDFVPGNLAGALALRDAGEAASRLEIAYFWTGKMGSDAVSGGTQASAAGVMLDPSFTWKGGRIVTERGAARVQSFTVKPGKRTAGISVGGSEQFALPRMKAGLSDVDVYLGVFGAASKPMSVFSRGMAIATKVPGVKKGLNKGMGRFVQGSTGGPDATARAQSGSLVIANAYDQGGGLLSEVRLEGANAYDFTADILAWGASRALEGGLKGVGALGPADGFGLQELTDGCAIAGLRRV